MSKLAKWFDLGFNSNDAQQPETAALKSRDIQQAAGIGLVGLVAANAGTFLAFGVVLLLASAVVSFLRQRQNGTYWQIACWALVTIGIVARQIVRPDHTVNLSGIDSGLIISSGIVSLAVLPPLMRWINRASPRPSLFHVAVPFSLGFFSTTLKCLSLNSRYICRG